MVESVICVLLVGTLFVAAMNTVGYAKAMQYRRSERGRGYLLAQSLMAEIITQAYEEPDDTPQFGRESESGGDRKELDDIDDYDGWSQSPPETKDENTIPGFDDWTRSVEVAWVNPDDLSVISVSETGAKRITVTVKRGAVTHATLVAIRTNGR